MKSPRPQRMVLFKPLLLSFWSCFCVVVVVLVSMVGCQNFGNEELPERVTSTTYAKNTYCASNKKGYTVQITHWLHRQRLLTGSHYILISGQLKTAHKGPVQYFVRSM